MAPPRPKSRAEEAFPSTMNGGGGGGGGGGAAAAANAGAAAGGAAADAFDPAFDLNAFLSADPSKLTAPIPTVKDKYELVPAFLQVSDLDLVERKKARRRRLNKRERGDQVD